MKKFIGASATFCLGAMLGFGLQSVIAQDQRNEGNSFEIYHSPTGGSANFYIAKVSRNTGDTWISVNGKDYKKLEEK